MLNWVRRALPPSGGLFYHYLALRFAKTLWRPFREDVANWLDHWNPVSRELIVFGCSAGYSIPDHFFERFDRVIAVEPDPFARILLKKRFAKTKFEFVTDPKLLAPETTDSELHKSLKNSASKSSVEKLKGFIARYPQAAILFSNVLGQLPLEFPHLNDTLFAAHLVAIRGVLKSREWASYHDLLSTWARPKNQSPFELEAGPFDAAKFASRYLKSPGTKNSGLELTDHQTHAFSAGLPTACAWWELAPGRFHLIGFLSSAKPN